MEHLKAMKKNSLFQRNPSQLEVLLQNLRGAKRGQGEERNELLKIVDDALIENVAKQVQASLWLRMNYNFHEDLGDESIKAIINIKRQLIKRTKADLCSFFIQNLEITYIIINFAP